MNKKDDLIQECEISITEAKVIVERANMLDRLNDNADFQVLIREGYLKEEAIRLVHLKGDPAVSNLEVQASISRQIDGISGFLNYTSTIYQLAQSSRNAIESNEKAIKELYGLDEDLDDSAFEGDD